MLLPQESSSLGGKDPGQLANLMRQGRLNELIRQASDGLGGADAAVDAAVAAAEAGKPEAAAGSTAKGVARLNLNKHSAAAQPSGNSGGGGGGYAKAPARLTLKRESASNPSNPRGAPAAEPAEAPQPATPKQAAPLSPRLDGAGSRGASSTRYVRPPPAALQSPRTAAAVAGPFVPKWLQGGEQPATQQAEAAAPPQQAAQQSEQPQPQPPEPQQLQQPLPDPQQPQQDDAQQQEHPHGPPPKTPSFDQWAHHEVDIPASQHSPAFGASAAAAAPPLGAVPEQHGVVQPHASVHGDSSSAATGHSAAAQPQPTSSGAPKQHQAQQTWPDAAGSQPPGSGSATTDASAAAEGQSPAYWHGIQHVQDQAAVPLEQSHQSRAAVTAYQPADPAADVCTSSQQWQPPAVSAAEQHAWQQPHAARDHQQQQSRPQQQHEQQDWQQHQQAQQQGWQQPEQQQRPADVATSQPGAYQHDHQQPQQYDQSWPPHSQPQTNFYDAQHQYQQQQPQQQQPYQQQHGSTTYKPATSQAHSWQDASGSHSYQSSSSGYRHDTYSTTLATIAAAKERWGNTTRWQPLFRVLLRNYHN